MNSKLLSEKETRRYSRHLCLPGFGAKEQLRLKEARALIVGVGGLGSASSQYLVAAGLGQLGIVDGDSVDESNLQRQILYRQEDIGKPKAMLAQKRLEALNPYAKISAGNYFLDENNAVEIIKEYDIVVDGADNFETRYIIDEACAELGKTYVYGSIFEFEGQVSVFNYRNGPTYRCLYPDAPDKSSDKREIGVIGALPGIVGSVQAAEAVKILTGCGEPLAGKLWMLDILTMKTRIIGVEAAPDKRDGNKKIFAKRSDGR